MCMFNGCRGCYSEVAQLAYTELHCVSRLCWASTCQCCVAGIPLQPPVCRDCQSVAASNLPCDVSTCGTQPGQDSCSLAPLEGACLAAYCLWSASATSIDLRRSCLQRLPGLLQRIGAVSQWRRPLTAGHQAGLPQGRPRVAS